MLLPSTGENFSNACHLTHSNDTHIQSLWILHPLLISEMKKKLLEKSLHIHREWSNIYNIHSCMYSTYSKSMHKWFCCTFFFLFFLHFIAAEAWHCSFNYKHQLVYGKSNWWSHCAAKLLKEKKIYFMHRERLRLVKYFNLPPKVSFPTKMHYFCPNPPSLFVSMMLHYLQTRSIK